MIPQRYGGLKIVWNSEKLAALRDGAVTAPVYVRLKPTNACNHRCAFCSYDPVTGDISVRDNIKNRNDEIPCEKLFEILGDFKEMGVRALTYSGGGEPLIYPYIAEAMRRTLDYNIGLSIISNGQKLSGERAEILTGANWVRVSSDASDAETFSKSRRVPIEWFDELTRNIYDFARKKRKGCELGINFVVHKGNASQVYQSAKHFRDLGVNHVKFTPMWIKDFEGYHREIKESVVEQVDKARADFSDASFSVYDTYKNDFSRSGVRERGFKRCFIMQTVPVIGADCNVYFCHDKAYSRSGVLGSLKDKSFRQLWFSDEAKRIFNEFNPLERCLHHCANDAKNSVIQSILDCYGDDVDFI